MSQPSHLGILECGWHVTIFCNNDTKSRFLTKSTHFHGVGSSFYFYLPLLSGLWKSIMSDFVTEL